MFRYSLLVAWAVLAGTERLSAQATAMNLQPPVLSRMCLWNANKDTWSELGLSKSQVRRLEVIKQRYPAVVEGQWIVDDKEEERRAGSGVSSSLTLPRSRETEDKPRNLQGELRAVLMPEQLAAWIAYCNDQITQ